VPHDTGHPVGTKVGIGSGSVFGAFAICAVVCAFCWPRNRAERKEQPESERLQTAEKDGNEVYSPAMLDNDGQKFELVSPVSELPLGHEAQEMEAKHGRAELPGCPAFEVHRGIVPADEAEGPGREIAVSGADHRTDEIETTEAAETVGNAEKPAQEHETLERRADKGLKQDEQARRPEDWIGRLCTVYSLRAKGWTALYVLKRLQICVSPW